MNPDIQLRHDVFAQINWDPAVNACDVDVQVKNGVVILRGEVADEFQRAAAERAARRTSGFISLLNRLTVRSARPVAPLAPGGVAAERPRGGSPVTLRSPQLHAL